MAAGVHGDAIAPVRPVATNVAGIVQGGAISPHLGHKGVVEAAIEGQIRPHSHRKGLLGGASPASDISVARGVHSYAIAIVRVVAANVAGIVQGSAISPHLGHKAVLGSAIE